MQIAGIRGIRSQWHLLKGCLDSSMVEGTHGFDLLCWWYGDVRLGTCLSVKGVFRYVPSAFFPLYMKGFRFFFFCISDYFAFETSDF